MTVDALNNPAGFQYLDAGDLGPSHGSINVKLPFAVLNLVSIGSKGAGLLAQCCMTTAAFLAAEVFFKYLPIIGAVISMAASLACIVISLTKMSRCQSKIDAVIAQNKANGNYEAVKEVNLYQLVKKMEVVMHIILFALSVIAIALIFFSAAAFFLPGLILLLAVTVILFIAHQIIHNVCKIDEIERKHGLDVPLNE